VSDHLTVLELAELLDELGSRDGVELRVHVEVPGYSSDRLEVVDARVVDERVVLEAYPVE
jgi:hypothetical protein